MKEQLTRRAMLTGTAVTAATLVGCKTHGAHGDHHEHAAAPVKPAITLKQGATVLLQGDSITDAGRDKKNADKYNDFAVLGNGYAKLIAYHLLTVHADKQLKIYNRGISGHKVPDLDARWDKDCIDLKPDVLSILIGVNDMWHKMNGRYQGTPESYETGYKALLKRTKDALPDIQIVVCEPFALRCGAVKDNWFPEWDQRVAGAKAAAESVDALYVPFEQMFKDAVTAGSPPAHWGKDGVHPSGHGQGLMAARWLSETGLG
ncbi:MAG: SGNH/GDSL hydrolase family protein [Planctomycetota bacterium]